VWDLPAAKELRRWQATQWIRSLGISPDGKTVAASQHTPFIRFKAGLEDYVPHFHLWDAESGRSKLDLSKEIKEGMSSVVFSPDGKWLAAGHGNTQTEKEQGKIFLIDPTTGKKIRELAGHPVGTNDLAFHPDGKHLFSCGRDQQIKIWVLQDGKLVHEFGKFADRGVWINAISISLDGKLLAAADGAGHVLIYSLTT
jgi:WD40 repeat protein